MQAKIQVNNSCRVEYWLRENENVNKKPNYFVNPRKVCVAFFFFGYIVNKIWTIKNRIYVKSCVYGAVREMIVCAYIFLYSIYFTNAIKFDSLNLIIVLFFFAGS